MLAVVIKRINYIKQTIVMLRNPYAVEASDAFDSASTHASLETNGWLDLFKRKGRGKQVTNKKTSKNKRYPPCIDELNCNRLIFMPELPGSSPTEFYKVVFSTLVYDFRSQNLYLHENGTDYDFTDAKNNNLSFQTVKNLNLISDMHFKLLERDLIKVDVDYFIVDANSETLKSLKDQIQDSTKLDMHFCINEQQVYELYNWCICVISDAKYNDESTIFRCRYRLEEIIQKMTDNTKVWNNWWFNRTCLAIHRYNLQENYRREKLMQRIWEDFCYTELKDFTNADKLKWEKQWLNKNPLSGNDLEAWDEWKDETIFDALVDEEKEIARQILEERKWKELKASPALPLKEIMKREDEEKEDEIKKIYENAGISDETRKLAERMEEPQEFKDLRNQS